MDQHITVKVCPACKGDVVLPYLHAKDWRVTKEDFALDRCAICGLVITQPQPAEALIGRYYETDDYISHAVSARSLLDRVYHRVRLYMAGKKHALIRRYTTGKRLTDIGAGNGFFAAFMQSKGYAVSGFEPSANARTAALNAHHIELNEMQKLFQQESASADAVTLWHVLEHVHDPETYLQSIHRILAPDGVLFLAMPNYRALDAWFYGTHWAAWDVPRHLWHFHTASVRKLFQRTGFELIRRRGMPFDAFYVSLLSEKYRGSSTMGVSRGFVIGLLSNIRALINPGRSSSVLYIARKV